MLWNDVPMALEKPAGKRWQQRTNVRDWMEVWAGGVVSTGGFSQVGRHSALASGATMGNWCHCTCCLWLLLPSGSGNHELWLPKGCRQRKTFRAEWPKRTEGCVS